METLVLDSQRRRKVRLSSYRLVAFESLVPTTLVPVYRTSHTGKVNKMGHFALTDFVAVSLRGWP